MLVLSRKIGESIQIDGGIRITVTKVQGGRVRLSIEAPQEMRVLRKELTENANPSGVQPEVNSSTN